MSTKTITVSAAASEYGNIFRVICDGESIDIAGEKGIGLVVYEKDSKTANIKKIFDCSDPSLRSSLCSTLDKIKDGSYVIMGTKGDVVKSLTADIKHSISMLGSLEITRLNDKDSWAMMVKKSSPHSLIEYRKQDLVTFNHTI